MSTSNPGSGRWVSCINVAGEEIPAFACVRIADAQQLANGVVVVNAAKPDGSLDSLYYFNGNRPIAIAGHGQLMVPAGPTWALYSGSPSAGQEWGPVNASWALGTNSIGFKIVGLNVSADTRILVDAVRESRILLAKFGSDVAKGSSETFTIYADDFTTAIGTATVKCHIGAYTADKMAVVGNTGFSYTMLNAECG